MLHNHVNVKIKKAKHPKDWTDQTNLYSEQTVPGGKNGKPAKFP